MDYSKEQIEALQKEYGLPLHVFDEKGFTENYKELYTAMSSQYGRYQISYSFKTNYTPYICLTAKRLGAYAEVVSEMEYELAKRIGFEDSRIIFNGPDKGEAGIEASQRGALVNVDSPDELNAFCKAAEENPAVEYRIGLRANLDIGQGFVSRFGMDEADLERSFGKVSVIPNLHIIGLHCHISRCRGAEAWRKRTEYMLQLAERFFENAPEYIDLGSGMFGRMAPALAAQFDSIPTYEEYAQVTARIVADHYRGQQKQPILFTEPGTTLINRFVNCITRVESIKSINGHKFAVLNASIHNLGETCTLKRLPVQIIPGGSPQIDYQSIDLTGYTCLEQDVLLPSFKGKMAKGDYVVFENTGGYSNVLKPPFIQPGCVMIAEKLDGTYELIKDIETYEYIFQTYFFRF